MGSRLLALIIMITAAAGMVRAEAPFLDLTYEQAIKKAGEENKQVFIDFFTTWCGPCKMLDRTTWKDQKVQAWLHKHTVPLKIDAEKQKSLAKRLKVKGYPTMVFIHPDGKPGGRLVGYRDASTFLKQAKEALKGLTPLQRARDALAADPESTSTHRDLAEALAEEGQNEEALEHLEWCWVQGVNEPGFGAVRRSYLLNDIVRLGRSHPPAIKRLEKWLAQARQRIAAGEGAREDGGDFVNLSESLDRPATERLAFYDELGAAGKSAEQQSLVFFMTDDFYEAERFEDYGSTLDLETKLYFIESTPGMLLNMPPEHRTMMLKHQVQTQARDIEVLLILGRSNEVKQLLEAMKSLQLDAACVGYIKDAAGSARKRGAAGVPSDAEIIDLFSSSEQGDTPGSRKGPNSGS